MTDLVLTLGWLGGLACGLGGAIVLHRLGLASTYVRDLLHVGAGVWILGWAWWTTPAWPIAITAVVTAGTALVPTAASRWHLAARLHRSVTGGDERWSGLVLYTLAYAALTPVGLCDRPLPAAAGLLALSLGDGVGGAVGRRFGRHHYRAPGGKVKSLEGSATVAVMALLAATVAAAVLDAPLSAGAAVAAAAVAAVAEAAAPRGTDNVLVPLAVWATLSWLT